MEKRAHRGLSPAAWTLESHQPVFKGQLLLSHTFHVCKMEPVRTPIALGYHQRQRRKGMGALTPLRLSVAGTITIP